MNAGERNIFAGVCVGTLMVMSSLCWAGDLEEGVEAYDNKKYELAAQLFAKAAKQGIPAAEFSLGYMYFKGEGVRQSNEEAFKWFEKAATKGDKLAQYNLAVMLDDGRGVKRDFEKAAYWYRKAAEQGDALAQANLGVVYYDGKAVKQDYVEAYKWFWIALKNGADVAMHNIKNAEKFMSAAQIADAKRRAQSWIDAHPPAER